MLTVDHTLDGGRRVGFEIGSGRLATGKAPGWNPSKEGCSVSPEVDDFDAAMAGLKAANVEFNFGPIETSVCHMGFARDPEGNSIGIHRRKPGHT